LFCFGNIILQLLFLLSLSEKKKILTILKHYPFFPFSYKTSSLFFGCFYCKIPLGCSKATFFIHRTIILHLKRSNMNNTIARLPNVFYELSMTIHDEHDEHDGQIYCEWQYKVMNYDHIDSFHIFLFCYN
jgi:hypothetical protein